MLFQFGEPLFFRVLLFVQHINEHDWHVVACDGQIDLWPQGPGQYMTTPKGYTTAGKGSTYMAGALVGRVGENGRIFLIGERYDGAPSDEGRLFLQIVPSPWNNASTGSYHVRINTDHVALTAR